MNWHSVKRAFRFWWQRVTRGWDDSETWSLDSTIGKFVSPRLKRLREIDFGHPSELTQDEWNLILQKMIDAFEFAGSDYRWTSTHDEHEKHQEGIDLFAKYFWSLWW